MIVHIAHQNTLDRPVGSDWAQYTSGRFFYVFLAIWRMSQNNMLPAD